MLEMLDSRTNRGTYQVTTENGTRYLVEVHRNPAGTMRAISDGEALKEVVRGIVGCYPCSVSDPVIRKGSPLHLSAKGGHFLLASSVVEIRSLPDHFIDTVLCPYCQKGYKPDENPCRACSR